MSGSNKVLKEGSLLFRAGDKPDGMYLVRKGELRVYLEQDAKEVTLATVGAGGMIGEMSLFDKQARSASVKAVTECEVTQITDDDFGKLMKQIPKWFVSLMSSLSTRLRQTNERLQKLEAGGGGGGGAKGKPYQSTQRILAVLILLWAKDGAKDGKEIVLQRGPAEKTIVELFGEDAEKVKQLIELLVKHKILTTRTDSYKNVVFTAPNRALFNGLPQFIVNWLKVGGGRHCLNDGALQILKVLERMIEASPYDSVSVSLDDLTKEGSRDGSLKINTWKEDINQFKGLEEVKLVKMSNGMGLKSTKKDVASFARQHELLAALYKSNLA